MAKRHPTFELVMDVLIIVFICLGIYSTYAAHDAENRTRDIAVVAARQARENCETLRQGRIDANERNQHIINFIHLSVPKDERNTPQAIAYFKLAQQEFGQKLEVPECP